MNFHCALRAEFLTAEALDTLASVNLGYASIFVGHHGYGMGGTDVIALFAAHTLIFL